MLTYRPLVPSRVEGPAVPSQPRNTLKTRKASRTEHQSLTTDKTQRQGVSGCVFLSRLGKPHTPAGLRSVVKRAAKDAGIDLPGSYRLRHTFGQWIVDSGASVDEVGAALGHEPGSRETQIYAQVRRDRAVKAIEALDEQVLAEVGTKKTFANGVAPAKRKSRSKTRRKAV